MDAETEAKLLADVAQIKAGLGVQRKNLMTWYWNGIGAMSPHKAHNIGMLTTLGIELLVGGVVYAALRIL